MIARRLSMLLAVCVLIPAVLAHSSANSNAPEIVQEDLMHQILLTYPMLNKEDIGYLKNIIDEYRSIDPGYVVDVHAPTDRLWKRNANIINTLLGFPRRMLMAGR